MSVRYIDVVKYIFAKMNVIMHQFNMVVKRAFLDSCSAQKSEKKSMSSSEKQLINVELCRSNKE